MNKKTLQETIAKAVQESFKDLNDRVLIKSGDIQGLVSWLDSSDNWEAAAKAVSMGRGNEDDLVNFVKAHREFDDWSWGQVKDSIDQANDMNLMEHFKVKMKIVRIVECAYEAHLAEIDRGDTALGQSADFEKLRNKITQSKNPQLINTFDLIAKKYRDKLSSPGNLAVISKAIDTAATQNRWVDLEKWFMDQVIKTNTKQSSLQEFVLTVKK